MVTRYVNGPVKQEAGIFPMPPHPQHYRMLPPPQRAEGGYHVVTPPAYIQQPQPPNQGNNQVQPLRGMPPTGPPNQASTPPNTDLKVQMQPQQPSINLAFVSQIPVRGPAQNMFPRAPQPSTPSSRMANHRQGQQHMFQTQPQYVPIMQSTVPYLNSPAYFNSAPRPQPGYVTAAPYQMIPGPAYPYPAQQSQSATYYYNGPLIQRPQLTSVATIQPNPTQPPTTAMAMPAPAQQVTAVGQKRRKHAIPIIDPNTGKELKEYGQDDSHPASGESSARQTPQPPFQNPKDVQAAFVRQVTEAIKDEELTIIEDFEPPIIDPISHMYSLPPQTVPHQRFDSIVHNSKLQVATKEFIPAALNNIAKETTPVVSAITDAVEVTITNKPKDRESPVKSRKQRETPNITLKEPPVSIKEKEDMSVCENPINAINEEIKAKDSSSIATSIAFSKEIMIPTLDQKVQQKEVSKPFAAIEEIQTVEYEFLSDSVPVPNLDIVATNTKSKQVSTKTNELPRPQQSIPLQSQTHMQPHVRSITPPAPVLQKVVQPVPLSVPVTQPTKPTNKRNKMQEINLKGALKEGTDMDAFNDNTEQNNITNIDYANSDYINNDNNTMLNNNEDSNKNSDITTIKPITEIKPKSKFDVMDIVKDTPKPTKSVNVPPAAESPDEVDRAILANEKLVQAKNEANAKATADIIDTSPSEVKFSLPYQEDQWSPLNPEGKKVYGFEFLMALKNDSRSKSKPDIIIPIDIAVDAKGGRPVADINRFQGGGRQTDFAPSFGNAVYANKNSQRGTVVKRRSQQGASNNSSIKAGSRPSVIRVSISVKEDVKLREVENAWRPARFVLGDNMTEDEIKTADLYKKVRGVLNKLTPQKFSQLLEQVKSFNIDTSERLQGVIDLVFEKAVDEPNFSVAYANLCKELCMMQVPTAESRRKDKESQSNEFVNFRKLLVTRCQLEFEKNSVDESVRNEKVQEIEQCDDLEKKKELESDLEEYDRKLRMKSVGNIRFIGELFKQNMLTANIMLRCLNNLVTNKDEESLECLCKLMSTVGKELEQRKVDLNPIFTIMKEIVDRKHGKISSRVRFMIQDVIDLRQSSWVPRRQDFNPKTMDQIQKDAENEQLEIQALNSVPMTPRKDDRMTSGGASNVHSNERRNRKAAVGNSEDGWTTQTRNNRSATFNVISDKLKTVTPMHDEPLGTSGMFVNWSTGASAKPSVASSNLFSHLENLGMDSDKRQSSMGIRTHSKDHYNSKGPSLERNYRHNTYDDGRGSRSGSQHRSRDGSATHHITQPNSMPQMSAPPPPFPHSSLPPNVGVARDQPIAVRAAIEMPIGQFDVQLKKILEDYMTDSDINECDNDIKKAFPPSELPKIVTEGYNSVLERSKTSRWSTGQLFANLIKLGTLSVTAYCTGLTNFLYDASDLIIDIPQLWTYLGELITPLLSEGVLPVSDLHKCCDKLIHENHASKLLVSVFNLLIQEKSPNFLHSIWNSSGLIVSNFMPESEADSFITKNKFEFLLHADSSSSYKSNNILSQQEIYTKLTSLFRESTPFDDMVNWITANVGDGVAQLPFIRTLATACFEESIVQNKFKFDILKNRTNLILRYVDANPIYELQCLFAIQAIINKLEYPIGLVVTIFDKIYEENMFSHESFLAWEENNDPAEQEGKGVALKQLTSFFTQLKEVDDEDSCGSSEETGG